MNIIIMVLMYILALTLYTHSVIYSGYAYHYQWYVYHTTTIWYEMVVETFVPCVGVGCEKINEWSMIDNRYSYSLDDIPPCKSIITKR